MGGLVGQPPPGLSRVSRTGNATYLLSSTSPGHDPDALAGERFVLAADTVTEVVSADRQAAVCQSGSWVQSKRDRPLDADERELNGSRPIGFKTA